MADCTVQCVWRDGRPRATVVYDAPIDAGDITLPVTTMIDAYGELIDWENWDDMSTNPLTQARSIVAGPDSAGLWHMIPMTGDVESFES